jgi:hypothetical protein
MAYLIQNTRTDDFIDEHGEWTMIRSFAKKFPSKLDAERWIAKNGIDDYPPIYKVVKEEAHHRSFKKFMEAKKVIKEETSYEGDVINVAFDNAKITGQEFDDIYDSGFNIGKVYTWTQLEPMMIHARIPSSKIQQVKAELKKLEQMGKYDDFIYEGCKKKSVKEDVEQKIVIHTKNGKVDSIEQGTYMPNGVFIRNGGHSFDKGFIGMDPEEAKASLIKYSRIPEKMIIIEGCKKVTEQSLVKTKLGSLKVGDTFKMWNSGTTFYTITDKNDYFIKFKDKSNGKEDVAPKTMQVYLVTESKKIVENGSISQYSYGSKYKMVPFESIKRGDVIFSLNPNNKYISATPYIVKKTDGKYIEAEDGDYMGSLGGSLRISKDTDPMVPAIQNKSDASKAIDEYVEDRFGE